jgi:chromosome condensin MukBEF ATPase and DNA-binding subunit MukB
MLSIQLTEKERLELANVLEERMGELSQEIHHAVVSTYRDELRERKVRLELLLQKLADRAPLWLQPI